MPGEQAWKFAVHQANHKAGAAVESAGRRSARSGRGGFPVLPFRVNAYVLEELIDWDNVPDDPIYRLTFPHRDMLREPEYAAIRDLLSAGASEAEIQQRVHAIRMRMNPHPAGQMTHNVPQLDGVPLAGVQHKYKETVLFFPSAGQTCHAYCTFCFRWPQFVGMEELKFDARASADLATYLRRHAEVTDVLITGGDPLVMNARSLTDYIEPLLAPDLAHIQHIRIGTKAVAYWPQRFVTDKDADDLLRLFETVVRSGRNLALMGHYNHPAELRHPIAQQALRRIIATGATVRIQAPLIRHINENPADWAELWTTGVRLGAVPYYMFVERDTGPSDYFKLPLARAYDIFQQAYRTVSGLARTVRGPSMSAFPGKVLVDGIVDLAGERSSPCSSCRHEIGLGAPPVLRPVRSAGNLAGRIAAGVRGKALFFQQDGVAPSPTIPIVPAGASRSDRHAPSDLEVIE